MNSPPNIRLIKARWTKQAGHVEGAGGIRNLYKISVGRSERRRQLGRPRRRWKANTEMNLRVTGLDGVDWETHGRVAT